MSDVLYSPIVLRLNGLYQRIGWNTVASAFTAMMGGSEDSPPYLALDIIYNEYLEDGTPNYEKGMTFQPTDFNGWLSVPVRVWDLAIHGVRQKIRIPTVVICPNFKKMPLKEQRPTPSAIRRRDNNRCQYTGVELTNKTFSLDHITPRKHGGKETWENLVAAHREFNSKKGDKFNHEIGAKLLKKPIAPRAIPLSTLITEVKHPDHQFF